MVAVRASIDIMVVFLQGKRGASLRCPCQMAALMMLLVGALGCGASRLPQSAIATDDSNRSAWFEDVTDAVGLDFVNDPGPTGDYFTPPSMGSGGIVFPRRQYALPLPSAVPAPTRNRSTAFIVVCRPENFRT